MSNRLRQGRSSATMRPAGLHTVISMTGPIRSFVVAVLAIAAVSCSVDDKQPPAAHPDPECEEGNRASLLTARLAGVTYAWTDLRSSPR